jgi:hypothetical protein
MLEALLAGLLALAAIIVTIPVLTHDAPERPGN